MIILTSSGSVEAESPCCGRDAIESNGHIDMSSNANLLNLFFKAVLKRGKLSRKFHQNVAVPVIDGAYLRYEKASTMPSFLPNPVMLRIIPTPKK